MDFPLLHHDHAQYPDDFLCPICKARKIGEPHSMIILHGGYFLDDRIKAKYVKQYWGVLCHGAHDKGEGNWRDVFIRITPVDDLTAAEHRFIFCSTDCLREFFNSFVDEIESRIIAETGK